MSNSNDPRAIPPLPAEHTLFGDTPVFKQTADETFGGVPALNSPDIHGVPSHAPRTPQGDIEQRGLDEAIEDVESAEDCDR